MLMRLTMKPVALLLVLALGITAVGCAAPVAEVGKTRTVIDQLGREVEVAGSVNRIISTNYMSTYMVLALGAAEQLVGIEMKAETRPLYQHVAPAILELPQVGSAKTINIEAILDLEPDLVILPARLEDSVAQLEQVGLTVVIIDPEDLDSLAEAFLLLGTALGVSEKAEEIVAYYRKQVDLVAELTAETVDKPRVYLAGSELLRTCTREMYQHDIIELAGGDNVACDLEVGYWANVSLEQVLSWDPEVILLADYNEAQAEELAVDEKWQGVTAVKDGNIYSFPSPIEPWDSPGPGTALGILWLTHVLYPEAYGRADLEQEVEYFYRHFYGAEIPLEEFDL